MDIIESFKTAFRKGEGQSLGIDLGHHATKIVKMNCRQGTVDFCGLLKTPLSEEVFFHDLGFYLKDNGLTGFDTAVCLDDPSIKIKKVELPKMPEGDLREAIKWKMRDVVDGDIDEFTVRHSVIKEESHTEAIQVISVAYAVRSSVVTNLRNQLIKCGVRVKAIEPSAVSLAAAVERVCTSADKWVAAIDLGHSRSIMIILGHGKLYFSRPLAGINLEGKVDDATFSQRLAGEMQNSLDTFAVTFRDEKINTLLLSGGGAARRGLKEYLSTNLALETEIVNAFAGIKGVERMPSLKEGAFLFTQAVSLAQTPYD